MLNGLLGQGYQHAAAEPRPKPITAVIAATRIRKQYGLEAARAVLGHKSLGITVVYAEQDTAKVEEIARRAEYWSDVERAYAVRFPFH